MNTTTVFMVSCPACGKDVSSKAAHCPTCGHPIRQTLRIKRVSEVLSVLTSDAKRLRTKLVFAMKFSLKILLVCIVSGGISYLALILFPHVFDLYLSIVAPAIFHVPILLITNKTFPGKATRCVQTVFSLLIGIVFVLSILEYASTNSDQVVLRSLFLLFWSVVLSLPMKALIGKEEGNATSIT